MSTKGLTMYLNNLFSHSSYHIIWVLLISTFFFACDQTIQVQAPQEPRHADAADFEEAENEAITLADGFTLDLWAPGPLLSNAVAISFDPHGVAYVSETQRRKSSDIDIRQHREWIPEELGLSSMAETEAFHYRKLDSSLSEQNTWQEDFNEDGKHDWRDLMVQSEYIRRVWDSDGDGRADSSTLFADGFNSMLTGVAAGILVHGEDIFLTAAPDVFRIQDSNEDGVADKRTVISHGYGVHIGYAGHDMSGLTLGVDGKIYWSIGDIGTDVKDQDGKKWSYPHEGSVMRANPDGSEFEVFAHGLRNPQELAFNEYGDLISVDNDGDHKGEHERIVHILEGSDSGWRIHWQFGKYNEAHEGYKVWMDERLHVPHFPGQAAFLLPPISLAKDGPAGLAYNPGTAMGEKWKNYFFSSHFKGSAARSQIQAFQLAPKGTSYAVADEQQVVLGIASTGISFGPDGSLYIADWKDSYDKKTEGRIWKLDVPSANPMRQETKALLETGFADKMPSELAQLLAHDDMRVRMEAQFELTKREEVKILLTAAQSASNQLARLHGIWGIGQLARKQSSHAKDLLALSTDSDPEVRGQVFKVLGEATYRDGADVILAGLGDSEARVVRQAAEAAGKLQIKQAFEPMVALLDAFKESDPHMRHSLVYALSKLDQEKAIIALASHDSKWVRLGAVVALRHLRSAGISAFLEDSETLVLIETARAINDDHSIPEALPALAATLSTTTLTEEAFLRRAINANLRLGDAACAARLASFAQDNTHDPEMRADALWALGSWASTPILDRVDGRYRELAAHDPSLAVQAVSPFLPAFLTQADPMSTTAAEVAGRLNITDIDETLFALIEQRRQSSSLRIAALSSLVEINDELGEKAIGIALTDRDESLRTEAQSLIGTMELPTATKVSLLDKALANASVREQQKIFQSLGIIQDPASAGLLENWMKVLIDGTVEAGAQLDLLLAAEKQESEAIQQLLTQYQASYDPADSLAGYRETIYGGNARRGGRLAYQNQSAQCFRCHQVSGVGGVVGPDLTGIADVLSPEELLEALIEPSARIAPGYGAEGAPSGMPSMKLMLDKEEIRDVMAFLRSLSKDFDLRALAE